MYVFIIIKHNVSMLSVYIVHTTALHSTQFSEDLVAACSLMRHVAKGLEKVVAKEKLARVAGGVHLDVMAGQHPTNAQTGP